ncbi:hypothetical protein A3768_4255 (plasmid) [Ralstonia solanacearum]|nr:hypothetical protein A3768_4255 [Ralstonia solanacearum]
MRPGHHHAKGCARMRSAKGAPREAVYASHPIWKNDVFLP